MPRFLALDWDAGHAYVVAASVAKGAVRLERALSWPEEQPPTPATAAAFGQRLKDRLKDAKVAAAPLLVAVSRDRVTVKDVKFPQVPRHEEPAIVRFQAMREFTDAVEDIVLDYVTGETPEPSGERKAFVVAIRRDQLAAAKALAQAAGLKLAGMTPRAFCAVAALRRTANPAPEPGTAFAVLTIGDKGGEFVVARGEQLALARQLSGPALNADAALVGEIRRNLAVYAGQAGQQPVRALYVAEAAGPMLGIADRLRDTLAVPVYAFDPLAGLAGAAPDGPAGRFAGAAGLIYLKARTAELPIDFVHPREPKPPRDPNKRALGWAAAAAALLLLVLGGLGYSRLAAKEKTLKELRAEKEDLEGQKTKMEQDEKRSAALDDWLNSNVCLLDELYDLVDRFPDIEKLRLTQINVNPRPVANKQSSRFVSNMALKGLMTGDDKPLITFKNRLLADSFYDVGAFVPSRNSSGLLRGQYIQQWIMNIGVQKRTPDKYNRKMPGKAPDKDQKADGKADDGQEVKAGGAP